MDNELTLLVGKGEKILYAGKPDLYLLNFIENDDKTLNLQQFNQVVEVVQVAAFFLVGKYDVVCRELV